MASPTASIEWLLPMFATPILLVELALCALCGGRRLRLLYVFIVMASISASLLVLFEPLVPNRAVIVKVNGYEHATLAKPKAVIPFTAVVRVKAVALNPADYKVINNLGLIPFARWFLPISPSYDMSGVVEAVGPNCINLKVGDAIFGQAAGAQREYAVINCLSAGILPADVNFVQGAAGVTVGYTALVGFDYGDLKKGSSLLVIGSAGGCGQAAVLAAKMLELRRPREIGCIASGKNREVSLALGCDKFFDYNAPDFKQQVLAYYKDGVDFVYDTVSEPFPFHGPYVDWLAPKARHRYVTLTPNPQIVLSEHRAKHFSFTAIPKPRHINFMESHSDMFNKVKVAKVSDALGNIKNVQDSYALLKSQRTVGKIILTLDADQKRPSSHDHDHDH